MLKKLIALLSNFMFNLLLPRVLRKTDCDFICYYLYNNLITKKKYDLIYNSLSSVSSKKLST